MRIFLQKRFFGTLYNYRNEANPQVFLDVTKQGKKIGRIVIELFKNHCPKTAENYRSLCCGDNDFFYTYKGCIFHRIIPGFMAQGGDFTRHNGTGGASIYNEEFEDENLKLRHYKKGMLSMANKGPNTNTSQFFITFQDTPWLDGYHVVFGEVVEGLDVLDQMEEMGTQSGKTKCEIKIEDCGEIKKAPNL